MKKSKLTIMDVKAAVWSQKFRDLFPEYKTALEKYLKDPGCACNLGLVKDLMRKKDRMQQYFPDKECKTPEEEESELKNEWMVINCNINELEQKPKGKRIIAASRFKDRITAIANDVDVHFHIPSKSIEDHIKQAKEASLNWKVINTTTHELIQELNKLPVGRKMLTLTRFQDKVTLLVNDAGVLF
jgi:hypothetical protein